MRRSKNEYELVGHGDMPDFKMFLVRLAYRNPHSHKEFELCLILSGSVRLFTAREARDFSAGELFIVNPHETHEIQALAGPDGTEADLLSLQVTPRWCERFYPKMPYVEFSPIATAEEKNRAAIRQTLEAGMRHLALAYFSQAPDEAKGREFFCFARISDIFHSLSKDIPFRILTEGERSSRAAKSDRVGRITSYIETHFMEKILLADIARHEELTHAYLSHFFRDNLGMNFQRFVTLLRFDEARRLVERTDMPITDISLTCGFSDYRYLNRIYEEKLGCTPAEYRKQHRTERKSGVIDLSETDRHAKQRFYSDAESIAILGKR